MIPTFLGHNYYSKMLELEEKLRKSEKERIRLEERFCSIEKNSRLRHEACINKLRMHYIKFLEEQRVRDERNYKLLGALDRVDESLALMTVKTNRLCILKKEYEASLMRRCINRYQASIMTGDSGIHSQNEDKQLTQNDPNLSYRAPRSLYNIERRFYNPPVLPGMSKNFYTLMNPKMGLDTVSFLYATQKKIKDHNESYFQDRLSQLPNYGQNYQLPLPSRGFEKHSLTGEYAINNLNSPLRKETHNIFFPKELTNKFPLQYSEHLDSIARIPKCTSILDTLSNSKDEHVSDALENELDRYIHNIRNLHDNNNPNSLEEIEQNTSGDILNVTLSDDNLDHLPVEENTKEEEIPIEFKVILAIADELISTNVDDIHVKDDTSHVASCQSVEKIFTDVNTDQETFSEIITGDQVASINFTVSNADMKPVTSMPIQDLVDNNEINDHDTMYTTKINPVVENIVNITTSSCIADSSSSKFFPLPSDDDKIKNEQGILANTNDSLEIMNPNESPGQLQGMYNDNNIKIGRNPEAQNSMNSLIKTETQKIFVNKTLNSVNEWSHCQTDASYIDTVEKNCDEKNQDNDITKNDDIGNAIITNSLFQSNEKKEIDNEVIEPTTYDGCDGYYENSHEDQYQVIDNQDLQLYPQDLNQVYEYNNEQYHHDPNDPNQQYEYDSNAQCEQRTNGEYQYDERNLQYIEDSNGQFQDQQHIENDNEEYAINPNEQYHEYSESHYQQYDSDTYLRNPNLPYDSNAVYVYPTQEQNYMADNAHDESQTFASDQQQFHHHVNSSDINDETMMNYHINNLSNNIADNDIKKNNEKELSEKKGIIPESDHTVRTAQDVIKSILDSDTESTVEKNISNTESDFDFN